MLVPPGFPPITHPSPGADPGGANGTGTDGTGGGLFGPTGPDGTDGGLFGGPVEGTLDVTGTVGADPATLEEVGAANTNWAETNAQIGGLNTQMQGANANWAATNQSIDSVAGEWGRTNDTLETFTNPMSVGVLAASAGAGAVLGAAAARVALGILGALVKGAKKLFFYLKEKITHEKENEGLVQAFHAAQKVYETAMSAAAQLEAHTKQLIGYRDALKAHGIEDATPLAIEVLNTFVGYLEKKEQRLQSEFDAADEIGGASIYRELEKCRGDKKNIERARDGLTEDRSVDLDAAIAGNYNLLILLEAKTEGYRTDMLAAKKELMRRLTDAQEDESKKTDRILRDAKPIYTDGVASAKKRAKAQRKKVDGDFARSVQGFEVEYGDRDLPKAGLREEMLRLRGLVAKRRGDDVTVDDRLTKLFGRVFDSKWYYLHDTAKAAAELRALQDHPSAKGDFRSWRKQQIDDAKDRKIAAHKQQYIETLERAASLRRDPGQEAEIFVASLLKNFGEIEADQAAFNTESKVAGRHVTRGRLLRAKIEGRAPMRHANPEIATIAAAPPMSVVDVRCASTALTQA